MPLKIWDEEDGQGSLFMEVKVRHVKMPISWRSTNINTDQEKDTKFAPFSWTANNVQKWNPNVLKAWLLSMARKLTYFSSGYSTIKMKGVVVAENIQISDKCDFDHCRNCQICKNGFRRWQDKNAHEVQAALSTCDKKLVKAKFNRHAGENCLLSKGKGVS